MNPIYAQLVTFHYERLYPSDGPAEVSTPQSFRNQVSTLHSYLAFCGKTDESRVGRELLGQFDEHLKRYIESLPVTPHTKSDRRSHLRSWCESANAMMSQAASGGADERNATPSEFHRLLRQAIAQAEERPKTIARRCGASTSAIQRWLKGAFPNVRARPSIHRLELALNLPQNSLTSVAFQKRNDVRTPIGGCASIAYRERHRKNVRDTYRLKVEQLTVAFKQEWTAYFEYKTTRRPRLERSTRGVWRLLPDERIGTPLPALAYRMGFGSPTASIALQVLRGFFGYLCLPPERGGPGLQLNEVQSLGWLAVSDYVNSYCEFQTRRSAGIIHEGQKNFAQFVASLTHPRTGYLTQQPNFAHRLPVDVITDDWTAMCAETFRLCAEWKNSATNISRDPKEPIRALLALQEPLAPIFRAIKDLDNAAAAAPSGSRAEALHKRDALLLSMLVSNPLRLRNYIIMKYRENQSAHLYVQQDGQWRLRFQSQEFKNEKGAAHQDYDAPLPRAIADRIVDYLAEYRPRLVRDHPGVEAVFPSSSSEKPWHELSRHVFKLIKRYVPETLGFGEHYFRYLVATDYLRKHPEDYLTVAQLLHDKLETVLRAYAHLRKDDSFGKYEQHLDAIRKG